MHVDFSRNVCLLLTVQREIIFLMWTRIVGHMVLFVLCYSWLIVTIPVHVEQYRNTYFQCGKSCLLYVKSHIVDMAVSNYLYIYVTMRHYRIFISLINKTFYFTRSSVLCVMTLVFNFFIWLSLHVNKDKCILLADIQHSHPHITL